MDKNIAISILDAKNIPEFLKNIKEVDEKLEHQKIGIKPFVNIIHFDVMDKKFVQNEGIDLKYIKTAKNMGFYADTHLMVSNPIGDKYIEQAIEYGTDCITIHYEINNFEVVLKYLNEQKQNLKKYHNVELQIGVSIKPNTDILLLKQYSDMFDKILLMSVEPGMGGQKYIIAINDKIKEAKKHFKDHYIQVDGGINDSTLEMPFREDVDSFVVGSYLSKTQDIDSLYSNILKLNIIKSIEESEKNSNVDFDTKLLQIVPGGYGEGDILIGITVPNTRKLADKWYKNIKVEDTQPFISSKYHEYRRFAIYVLSNMSKKAYEKNDTDKLKEINTFLEKNLQHINNWDLTDEVGPNILGIYLLALDEDEKKQKIEEYITNNQMWIKRIGIVSLLMLIRKGETKYPLEICDRFIYNDDNLLQKATGWVLREIYKKEPMVIVEFLEKRNKKRKLPSIILSYACEKMSSNEKKRVRNEI